MDVAAGITAFGPSQTVADWLPSCRGVVAYQQPAPHSFGQVMVGEAKCSIDCYDGELIMEDKEAIRIAKGYVEDRLADESVMNVGLEEVNFQPRDNTWEITVGFSRPWNTPKSRAQEVMESLGAISSMKRSLKVIKVSPDGKVLSMKDRARSEAAP